MIEYLPLVTAGGYIIYILTIDLVNYIKSA
jgi:hypothetical protein